MKLKNNVKKSLDKKIKDKKSVSKIVDKYTTELQNCYNVKNVSFDQFIYPESTNNLELKNVLQQNVLEKGLGGNLIFLELVINYFQQLFSTILV